MSKLSKLGKLGARCPRCDALVIGGMRFCGKCGWDLNEPFWKETTAEPSAENSRPAETARGAVPKPTETARIVTPTGGERPAAPAEPAKADTAAGPAPASKASGGSHIRYKEYEGYGEYGSEKKHFFEKPPFDKVLAFFAEMSRGDRIKFGAAAAGILIVLIVAISLIARMNRKPPEPEISVPSETMHIFTPTPSPTPSPTPVPTDTPAPTQPPATAAPTATPGWDVSEVSGVIYAATDGVKIYDGPGAEFNVIATAYRGEELTRTGVLDGWTRIDYDGKEGYIAHGDVSMTKPEPTPTPTPLVPDFEVEGRDDIVTVDTGANLRIGPGREYDVVDTAGGGAQLHRTGVVGDWSQVEYDGYRVYVYTELLRGEAAPTAAPAPTDNPAPVPTQDSGYSGGSITMYQNAQVRSGPGTEYGSIGIAVGGTTYESSGKTGDWYIISFNGQTGYVYAGLVE
jgi:uncharacterized protein YgiM (DUF1202 family)